MVSSISKHCEWSHVLQEGDRLIAVGSTQDLARPNKKKKKKKKKGGKVADASFASNMINVRQMEPEKVADQLETLRLPITVQLQRPDLACVSLLKHRGLVPDEGDDGRKRHEFQKVWRALSMRVIDMQCRESGRPTDWLQKLHGDNKLMRQVIKHQKKWGVVKTGAEKKIVKKVEMESATIVRSRSARKQNHPSSGLGNTPAPGSAEADA
jgi:hypothetical protein